jgi:hypothetical protein
VRYSLLQFSKFCIIPTSLSPLEPTTGSFTAITFLPSSRVLSDRPLQGSRALQNEDLCAQNVERYSFVD